MWHSILGMYSAMTDAAPRFDLNDWHRRLHRTTGAMALHWNRASAAELLQWVIELRTVAAQMTGAAETAQRHQEAAP